MILKRSQKGDTILEVLIVITALSLILSASFSLANRNVLSTRQSAERGEAYKIAESGMEKFKIYISTPGADLPAEGDFFCFNRNTNEIVMLTSAADNIEDLNNDKSFTSPIYAEIENKGCKSPDDLYYGIIQRGGGTTELGQNTYRSFVRWPSVTGNGVDKADIVHRLYQDAATFLPTIVGSPVISGVPCFDNNNIALSLDISGSMDFIYTGTTKRIDAAKSYVNQFFTNLDLNRNGNRASLSVFSGRQPTNRNLVEMTTDTASLNSALAGVRAVSPGVAYATDLVWGLDAPYQTLLRAEPGDPRARKYLVLITDGQQDPSALRDEDDVRDYADFVKSQRVHIFAIGIYPRGSPDAAKGEALLLDVVSDPSSYARADSPADLESVLNSLSYQLECS